MNNTGHLNDEVEKLIRAIKSLTAQKRFQKANQKCKILFEYKPVSLAAINVKARILGGTGRFDEVFKLYGLEKPEYLRTKFQLDLISEDELEACRIIADVRKNLTDEAFMCRRDEILAELVEAALNGVESGFFLEKERERLNQLYCNEGLLDLDADVLRDMGDRFFNLHKDVESMLCYILICIRLDIKSHKAYEAYISDCRDNWKQAQYLLKNRINFVMIFRQLLEYAYPIVFVKDEEADSANTELFAMLFQRAGKEVWLIDLPEAAELEGEEDISQLNDISFGNIQVAEGIKIITPIAGYKKGKKIIDNTAQLLSLLTQVSQDNYCTVLCASHLWEQLNEEGGINKEIHRMSYPLYDCIRKNNAAIGAVGSYYAHIGQLYGREAVDNLNARAEVGISIVIPCKDNLDTLQHTLRTCLNQCFDDYEIVISDNSVGSSGIKEHVEGLHNNRVKYFKTPVYLPLNRSFEYAFLQAKGEFVFSIGADDGVCFHGLKELSRVLERYPDEEVIGWERSFYIWPNFSVESQIGQLIIPSKYKKQQNIASYNCYELTQEILNENMQKMYLMPLLYINSGCRRGYLKKIIEKTGRLFDGNSQDIYNGCVNMALQKRFIYIKNSITFAGMSSGSMGVVSIKSDHDETFEYIGNGYPVVQAIDKIVYGSDKVTLINAVAKIIRLKINKRWNERMVNSRFLLEQLAGSLDVLSMEYDFYLKNILSYAKKNHAEAYKWLAEEWIATVNVQQVTTAMLEAYEIRKKTPCYTEGTTEEGGMVCDSRKYGITNIYEACELYEKFSEG